MTDAPSRAMKIVLLLALAVGFQRLSAQQDPRARLLTDRRCNDCHTVAVLKVKASADVGPDLSAAYAEVPIRYGMPLARFFDQPAGVMRLVLGGRPSLGPAERDSLVTLFRDLYNEQLVRLDSAQRRVRPVDRAKPRAPKQRVVTGAEGSSFGLHHVVTAAATGFGGGGDGR